MDIQRTMMLSVPLTDDEVQSRGTELAERHRDYADVEAEKAETARDCSDRMKRLRADMDRLSAVVRTRQELRPIEVGEVPDYERNLIITIRRDTGEQVCSRPMSTAERQEPMRFVAEAAGRDPS